MSDAPQGEGWWQASDLKWYPPADDPSGSKRSGGRWILPAALGVVIALIAATVTFLVVSRDSADASTVMLEPVAATGTDPFTTSTTITEVADFPDSVKAVTTQLTSELTTNPTTGTLTTTGTTPGLYGGTRDNTACDSQALTDYLTDNPSKANAWATTQNIDTDDITDYIAGLTSAILTTDTLVTNHGYKNGKATARQSVLQAGTAVLIDNTGTPRARCSCGNPLTPPTKQKLTTQNTTGTPWTGYTTTNVTLITTGDTTTNNTFTFTDITTGDTYQQPIASGASTWVAVGSQGDENGESENTSVWTSSDGVTWEETASMVGRLNAVATGDGKFLAAGSGPVTSPEGIVITSADGRTWSDPVTVPFGVQSLAYGDGRWVVFSAQGQVATSTDGTTWTVGESGLPETEIQVNDVAYGDGRFLALVSTCGMSRCFPDSTISSTDGVTWQPDSESTGLQAAQVSGLAYTDRFGGVGYDWDALADGSPMSSQTTSPAAGLIEDGQYTPVTVTPTDLTFRGLGTMGSTWVVAATQGESDYASATGIWTSSDLSSWTLSSTIDATISDVAVSGSGATTPSGPASTTTTAPPAAGGKIDTSSPLLSGLAQLQQILESDPDAATQLTRAVDQLDERTDATWNADMVVALAASFCNDWAGLPEEGLTDAEAEKWATAIAPVLGITPTAARAAIDSKVWGPFQRLCE